MNEVRVLVVDDEPVTRLITDKVLQAQGFTVRSAESAEAAFALLAEDFRPDLILLDVVMPGMSGYEACRRLRADARYEHLPIVMLTALDDQKSIDEAYFSGATDFITKPLNMPLLPHRVRHLLRSAMTFQQLMASRETLLSTQKLAGLGDWTLDSSGALLECSEQFREMLGIGRPPRPASALLARVHPEDRARVEAARAGLRGGAGYEIEYRLAAHDGAVTHLLEVGYPNPPDQPPGAHGYTQDITKRVEVEAQVRRLAWFDSLTGLRNRSRMVELMADEMTGPGGAAGVLNLFFVHLTGLRKFALLFGQSRADGVLQTFAERLRRFVATDVAANVGLPADALAGVGLGRYDEADFMVCMPFRRSGNLPRPCWPPPPRRWRRSPTITARPSIWRPPSA